jgi:hypothetical protein
MPQPIFTDLIDQITVLSRAGIGNESALLAFDRFVRSALETGFAHTNPLDVIEVNFQTLRFMIEAMMLSDEVKDQLSLHVRIGIALGLMSSSGSHEIHKVIGPIFTALVQGTQASLSNTELLNVALATGVKVNGCTDIKSDEKIQREALGFFILLSIRNAENAVTVDNAICDVTNHMERGFSAYYKGQFQQIPKLSRANLFNGASTKWMCEQVIASLYEAMMANHQRFFLYGQNAIDSMSSVLIDIQFSSYQSHALNREVSVFSFLAKTLTDKDFGRGILRSISKSGGIKKTSTIQLNIVAGRIKSIGEFLNSKEITSDIYLLKNTMFQGICRAFSSSRMDFKEIKEVGIILLDAFYDQSSIVSLHEQLKGAPQDFLEAYALRKNITHLSGIKSTVKRKSLTEDFGL